MPVPPPSIGAQLVAWYRQSGRKLAWRQTTDPYAIWVAEIILQQTRVAQGQGYIDRFLAAFPTVKALADAPSQDVMKLWEGLGYYSRARNLQKAAKQIVAEGDFPQRATDWQALPGVGPYTARAVAAFAFGERVAVLDGNVFRVLSRVLADATPIDQPRNRPHFQALVDGWLGEEDPALFNHAIMDFGATVCTPRQPGCKTCPLQDLCQAHQQQEVLAYPVKAPKASPRIVWADFWHLPNEDGRFPIWRRPDEGFWKGLWVFPFREVTEWVTWPVPIREKGRRKHAFSHITWHMRLLQWPDASPDQLRALELTPPTDHDAVRYVELNELGAYPLPRAMHHLVAMLAEAQAGLF